jgi:UDP-glucose 4-epimerase
VSKWADTRVLITGASGFIGTHLARALSKQGAEVHGFSRIQRESNKSVLKWWCVNLSNLGEIRDALKVICPRVIFHLSSYASGSRELGLVLPIFQSEVIATVNLLSAATEIGTERIVLLGSMEESKYGDPPSSPYAAAKMTSRIYGQLFHSLYRSPIVFTRLFMTYGPGQPDWKIIPYCIKTLLRGEAPRIGSPKRKVDWIYISDAIDGLMAVAETDGLEGISLDLGSGSLVEIEEIVRRIKQIINPSIDPQFIPSMSRTMEQVRCANLAATVQMIEWEPKITLDVGLKCVIEDLKSRAHNNKDK